LAGLPFEGGPGGGRGRPASRGDHGRHRRLGGKRPAAEHPGDGPAHVREGGAFDRVGRQILPAGGEKRFASPCGLRRERVEMDVAAQQQVFRVQAVAEGHGGAVPAARRKQLEILAAHGHGVEAAVRAVGNPPVAAFERVDVARAVYGDRQGRGAIFGLAVLVAGPVHPFVGIVVHAHDAHDVTGQRGGRAKRQVADRHGNAGGVEDVHRLCQRLDDVRIGRLHPRHFGRGVPVVVGVKDDEIVVVDAVGGRQGGDAGQIGQIAGVDDGIGRVLEAGRVQGRHGGQKLFEGAAGRPVETVFVGGVHREKKVRHPGVEQSVEKRAAVASGRQELAQGDDAHGKIPGRRPAHHVRQPLVHGRFAAGDVEIDQPVCGQKVDDAERILRGTEGSTA